MNFGVPQGMIVGPILFILYINDLVDSSSLRKFTMYADDTTLSFETDDLPNSNNVLNIELNKVSQWLYSNHLALNVLKTHYMIFHKPTANPPHSYPLSVEDRSIGRFIEVELMGVFF